MKTQTVDAAEIEKFSSRSHEWWDERGPFAPLHKINALRVAWIKEQISKHFGSALDTRHSLLDVGCGGGLACEPLARLGARVTGIDAGAENIEAAKLHAAQSGLEIDYRCTTAEGFYSALGTGHSALFDVVLALEIIEHVADVPAFVAATCKLAKPGGLIIYSTLNRTLKSLALGVVASEYILRWVPRGTHQWEKFVKPSELAAHLRHNGVEIKEMTGMILNPLTWKWELNARDVGVNYMLAGIKTSGHA